MAKDRVAFAKRQREANRKRKAEEKRQRRADKKRLADEGADASTSLTNEERLLLAAIAEVPMGEMARIAESDLEMRKEALARLVAKGLLISGDDSGDYLMTKSGMDVFQANAN